MTEKRMSIAPAKIPARDAMMEFGQMTARMRNSAASTGRNMSSTMVRILCARARFSSGVFGSFGVSSDTGRSSSLFSVGCYLENRFIASSIWPSTIRQAACAAWSAASRIRGASSLVNLDSTHAAKS